MLSNFREALGGGFFETSTRRHTIELLRVKDTLLVGCTNKPDKAGTLPLVWRIGDHNAIPKTVLLNDDTWSAGKIRK